MDEPNIHKLNLDPDAESTDADLPAFMSPPEDAPPYYGFPLVPETETDGWIYGAITVFESEEGSDTGDGYVQAPDGTRAGLVWSVGEFETMTIVEPEDGERWGVYELAFPKRVHNTDDLRDCFLAVLPELQGFYRKLFPGE